MARQTVHREKFAAALLVMDDTAIEGREIVEKMNLAGAAMEEVWARVKEDLEEQSDVSPSQQIDQKDAWFIVDAGFRCSTGDDPFDPDLAAIPSTEEVQELMVRLSVLSQLQAEFVETALNEDPQDLRAALEEFFRNHGTHLFWLTRERLNELLQMQT